MDVPSGGHGTCLERWEKVDRQLIDLKDMAPFDSRKFRLPFDSALS